MVLAHRVKASVGGPQHVDIHAILRGAIAGD
jgi:hypothetical protein